MPTLHALVPDAELAHFLAVRATKFGITPSKPQNAFPFLNCNAFGLNFQHPVGMAAGFDKDGEAVMGLLKMGFAFVEVGTVTPLPQPGNPRPRIFRWKEHEAVLNRYGFNSQGHDAVYERLKSRPWEGMGIVGVNLGCNKNAANPVADFVAGVEKFGEVADYLVINVSSPNTPGLRALQRKESLRNLLTQVLDARSRLKKRTPILLKISPDESDQSLKDIVETVLEPSTRIDGLIVSNTMLASYEEAVACHAVPAGDNASPVESPALGGLSGRPLFARSTECLAKVAALTKGELPLIGVGGISDAQDALEKMKAGASLVQLYTSMIFQGPPVAHRIAKGLCEMTQK
ncbi:unnamed protein product [Dicrocoelium dendriticum]|nr:unnamed protein product [Dicrocoelium dendriticum]